MSEEIKQATACDLGKFQVKRVLNDASREKWFCVEARKRTEDNQEDDQPAVIILEKTPFTENTCKSVLSAESKTVSTFVNDIYAGYKVESTNANEIKATIIYPATQKHIDKYMKQDCVLVRETKELFDEKVAPHLKKNTHSIQWVYNILEKKSEVESILLEDTDTDTGFILCKDMKWDQKSTDDLHMIAMPLRRDITSIRDLRKDHLGLLKNIRDKSLTYLSETYNLSKDDILMYFHYQPSYYHLHIHVVPITYDNPPGSQLYRGHCLDTVIDNVELFDDYYAKATLCYALKKNETLYEALFASEEEKK